MPDSNIAFNRPPRLRPRWSAETVELPVPPNPPPPRATTVWLQAMLPVIAALLLGAGALAGYGSWLAALPALVLAVLSSGITLINERNTTQRSASEYAEQRALFADRLAAARARLRRLHETERAARRYLAPDPAELLRIAGADGRPRAPEPRLWERRLSDDDALELRLGSGILPAASRAVIPPGAPADRQIDQLITEYATLHQVPICLPLLRLGSLGIAGPRSAVVGLAYALLAQAATLHAPSELRIALIAHPKAAADWQWIARLPHCQTAGEGQSGRVLAAIDPVTTERLLAHLLDELSRRRESALANRAPIVIIVDSATLVATYTALGQLLRDGGAHGLIVVVLADDWANVPEHCAAVVEVDQRMGRWTRAGEAWPATPFQPDLLEYAGIERLASRLATIRLTEIGAGQHLPRHARLLELLELPLTGDQPIPPSWRQPPTLAWHEVPIGVWGENKPFYLNLNEQCHGPHGIIAGATGAGKSVLLQTIIVALAAVHGPDRLNLLLIDFKGGAALAPFAALPHTTGLVTDLDDRLATRAIAAVSSELRRRKAMLRSIADQYGTHVENIADYRSLSRQHPIEPLPNLLIVLDEFDEMARSCPDFVSALVRVVKQGRSLGVHLLIATQQPARVVSDEIRSQLSYFIALRLGSSEDSREMLQRPDAAFLPPQLPGRAYMRSGGEVRLLQVARLAAPPDGQSDLEAITQQLCAAGRAHLAALNWQPQPIWQPPLPAQVSINAPTTGWQALVGLLDIPQQSRQIPLHIDLSAGHLAIFGGPASGKSTALCRIVLDLAERLAPDSLWCYLIDGDGRLLSTLADLPHVGALVQPFDREALLTLFRQLDNHLRERRMRTSAGQPPGPLVLLVIDRLAVVRDELRDTYGESDLAELVRMARNGRDLGLRLIVSAERPADLPYRLAVQFDQRLALRMPDLNDYADVFGHRPQTQLPLAIPGRSYWLHSEEGLLEAQIALPAGCSEAGDNRELANAMRARAAAIAPAFPANAGGPPPLALLPERLAREDLPPANQCFAGLCLPCGQAAEPPGPAMLRLSLETPHALVIGPRRSGKSTTLITLAHAALTTSPPAHLIVIDGPRRSLSRLRTLTPAIRYIADETGLIALSTDLTTLRHETTKRHVLIIDDYHLCRERWRDHFTQSYSATPNLFQQLVEIAQTGNEPMHLIIAAGISYADDPLLRALDGARNGIVLWPGRYDTGTRLLGLSLPALDQRQIEQPPGRALLVNGDDEPVMVQVASD
ncbi:FtsK/SpoIIIE domain-containing protein [Chloroflexus sp.]|uniref:FtsK/SpoIIIE domain-containing protein n=1 Tax=Chloroflexus sp. TaxID=1904827 RepID=UPI00298F37E5|nr:FtsK/SpoIIIE domain-containing protein [Chloroflexus sp.]MDW8404722.1 FtsK/SpoIIIE domain-containing protein [Chloroflexus sp.]